MPNSPFLPFPGEEIRSNAIEAIINAQADIGRLLVFYRGHQKDCQALESVQLRILSIHMTLSGLSWPSTEAEMPFENPPAPPTPEPSPAPTPQEHSPSAPN